MSIKTTHFVERKLAIEIWLDENNIKLPNNEELGDYLDTLTTSNFKNFIVVDKFDGTENFKLNNKNDLID